MESSILYKKKAYPNLISHHVDTAYMMPGTGARPLPAHFEVVLEETTLSLYTISSLSLKTSFSQCSKQHLLKLSFQTW